MVRPQPSSAQAGINVLAIVPVVRILGREWVLPGLVVDGEVKGVGKVPSIDEVMKMLSKKIIFRKTKQIFASALLKNGLGNSLRDSADPVLLNEKEKSNGNRTN